MGGLQAADSTPLLATMQLRTPTRHLSQLLLAGALLPVPTKPTCTQ
jgi:hypothetical protein